MRKITGKNKICLICGKEFFVNLCYWNRKKYCCKECFGIAMGRRKLSEETKSKISISSKGKKVLEISKQKIRETRKRLGLLPPSHLGHKHSKETKEIISNKKKGRHCSPKTEFKKGMIVSEETKRKMSDSRTKRKHWNWQGGISYEKYSIDFDKHLKDKVKSIYNYQCQECYKSENELKIKLHIHHIDYNKKNNKINNLIPLCISCHMKTNYKRKDWTDYFKSKGAYIQVLDYLEDNKDNYV